MRQINKNLAIQSKPKIGAIINPGGEERETIQQKEEESKTNRLKLIPRGSNYSSRYNKLSTTKEKRLTILQQAKQGLH